MECGFSYSNESTKHITITDELMGFASQALTGTESGLYKSGIFKDSLNKAEFKNQGLFFLANYLNGCY